MDSNQIIDVRMLFTEITESLFLLLHTLSLEDWRSNTCYPNWTVKDIVTHLFQTGTNRLSRQRDFYPSGEKPFPLDFSKLSNLINQSNNDWTSLLNEISPQLLIEFLKVSEYQLNEFLNSQDLNESAFYSVAWAGETHSQNWFDIAREYTERWLHQQQIREAVKAPPITSPRYLIPVIKILILAIPFWYRDVKAPIGKRLCIEITGDSGGVWILEKKQESWIFIEEISNNFDERITLSEDTTWRLLTRSMPREKGKDLVKFSSNTLICKNFLDVKAIMMND